MPVHLKSAREIAGIRAAGRVAARALEAARRAIRSGLSLKELERTCAESIRSEGGLPTFLGYRGFPAAACVSVNEEVVHGIPTDRRLCEGDLVKIDVGVTRDGFIADMARTFAVGEVDGAKRALAEATEASFWAGCKAARPGNRVSDIGHAVQKFVEARGYSVVRELCGHGVGLELHEEPSIPNFGPSGQGVRLVAGMTLAIEPMVNAGGFEVKTLDNGWTVVAADGRPSAHFENTVLVTENEPEILTEDV
ncbi:MAG: type I methionyl aminopeptidase [bacterium]